MWSNPMIKYESSAPGHYQNSRNVCKNTFDAVLFGLVNYFQFLCERESDIVDGRAYCKLREAEKVAVEKSRKKWVGAKGGE